VLRRSTAGASRRRGQALAEFALAAPIFFVLMLGLIELGRAVYYIQILDSAARDGARYAIVHGYQSSAFGQCPSGPMPNNGTNTCDPNGDLVLDTVRARSIGVTDQAGSLTANVKWCDASLYQSVPPASSCGDYDLATSTPVPCVDWSSLGDGDNNRGQIVTVCVAYTYDSILAGVLPIPDFTVTGRATLVVNN
jgi:Flp pilus assembly protein TadG